MSAVCWVGLARLLTLEPVVGDAFHRADVDKARRILLDLASKNIADCDAVRAAIRRIEKQYGNREDGVPVGEDSERNEFYASKGLYGRVTVKGDLDAINGARLITLLEPVRSDTGEGRCQGHPHAGITTGPRFCELLCRYERAGLGPIEGGVKPHITVTASAKDMTDLQALKDLLPSTQEFGFAWTDWVGPISIDTARMLACDCTVTRILLDENGVPLDCGKEARTATVPQRRALAVRDGGCAFPGCGTPSGWCDAHHIVHWNDGGPTDLDNLILLCGHHHRTLHHTEWRLSADVDRPVSAPDRREQPTHSGVNRDN
ncbi:hypothetical protein GCM10020255_107790 [Rhodococcus baikonurensis]